MDRLRIARPRCGNPSFDAERVAVERLRVTLDAPLEPFDGGVGADQRRVMALRLRQFEAEGAQMSDPSLSPEARQGAPTLPPPRCGPPWETVPWVNLREEKVIESQEAPPDPGELGDGEFDPAALNSLGPPCHDSAAVSHVLRSGARVKLVAMAETGPPFAATHGACVGGVLGVGGGAVRIAKASTAAPPLAARTYVRPRHRAASLVAASR